MELIEMQLLEIQITSQPGAQIMILGELGGSRRFPVFIGDYEMKMLDDAIHGRAHSRPLTHELALNIIEGMKGNLQSVLIDDLHDETFYGKLVIRLAEGEMVQIDARPSDALVLAVRGRCPIFVADDVLATVQKAEAPEEEEE